jgi:hypothetical protein
MKLKIFSQILKYLFFLLVLITILNIELIKSEKEPNHYQTLNVDKKATPEEIKRAFKKLSLQYHPDKFKGNKEEAKKMFFKIANAYEILSDADKREDYDEDLKKGGKKRKNYYEDDEEIVFEGGNDHFSFEDLFESFFGGFNDDPSDNSNKKKSNKNKGKNKMQEEEEERINLFENTDIISLGMDNISDFYKRKEYWFVFMYGLNNVDDLLFHEIHDSIEFYSHFAEFLKENSYLDVIKVSNVDCDYEKEVCEDINNLVSNPLDVNNVSLPMIIFFDTKSGSIYYGKKDSKEILNFAKQRITNYVRTLAEENYSMILNNEENNIFNFILLNPSSPTHPPSPNQSSHYKTLDDTKFQIFYKYLADIYLNKKVHFFQTSDDILLNKFQKDKYPSLIFLKDPFNFISSSLKLDHYDITQIKNFINKEIKDHLNSNKKKELKFNFSEFVPFSIKKKNCVCDDIALCGIYVLHSDEEQNQPKKFSKIKRNFLQNILKNNKYKLRFCYLDGKNLNEFFKFFKSQRQDDENEKYNLIFVKNNSHLFIYTDRMLHISILNYIDELYNTQNFKREDL